MRIFSDIKIRNGPDTNGLYTITRVPLVYGDPSWVVAQLIKGGSENTLMPAPMFSVYIDNIKMAPDRRQDTQFVGKVSTLERQFDNQTQTYGTGPGIRYDVDRYMPVPYDMYLKLDCWTTNTTNKMQIAEQINTIFNPSIQLQQNSNLLDWTSIFEVWMEEFTWTNRSIPQGGEAERDVMSWKFKVPIWINPPAKVKRSSLIAEIVTNVFSDVDIHNVAATIDSNEYDVFRTCFTGIPTQIITTEGNYKIAVARNGSQEEITLLNADGNVLPVQSWQKLIQIYGQIEPNITKIRLKLDPNIDVSDSDIIGGIALDPVRQNVLIFTPDIDTLPANTILPIIDIIDPTEIMPGNGLPAAVAGQRYLLTSHDSAGEEPAIPPGVVTSPWGANIVAYPNDVIEFNGISWKVIFDSRNATGLNYLVNTSNATQYTFDGVNWYYTYYGEYNGGYWRIDNIIQTPDGTINQYE
jgi:hypothetical protein